MATLDATRPLLMVFFEYTDCLSGWFDGPFWQTLQRRVGSTVDIIGVTTGDHTEMLSYFLANQGIPFPVVLDHDGSLFDAVERLGVDLTPALVIATRQRRLLLLAPPPIRDTVLQSRYFASIMVYAAGTMK